MKKRLYPYKGIQVNVKSLKIIASDYASVDVELQGVHVLELLEQIPKDDLLYYAAELSKQTDNGTI